MAKRLIEMMNCVNALKLTLSNGQGSNLNNPAKIRMFGRKRIFHFYIICVLEYYFLSPWKAKIYGNLLFYLDQNLSRQLGVNNVNLVLSKMSFEIFARVTIT